MSFIRQPETAELDKLAEAEIVANIRELVLRTAPICGKMEGTAKCHPTNWAVSSSENWQIRPCEIDNLIGELQTLRNRMPETSSRIDREIVEYVTLSQSVRQLVKIFTEGVMDMKNDAASVSE